MAPIIEVNQLCKNFKELTAVSNLSFTVNEGDVYGFLGQNGAGKSTSIRMLLTLIAPTSGSINFFGKNLKNHRHEILRQVGAVIERPDLYKYLSAYDNLSIFAKMSEIKVSKSLIMNQLQMVDLADRAHSKVRTFSQGMKQRLGIAISLIHNPKVIILDEPTNGLDPQGIADMRNLILKLSREMGKTVVISSHLLSEIELVANRMLIIHKGKKMAEGVVSELLDPSKTIVQIETLNNNEAKGKLLLSKWAEFVQQNNGLLLLQMNKGDIPQLTIDLVAMNIPVLSIQPRHSLEDYFISLTNPNAHVEAFAN
ncbi:MAG: ABC transporter ATP-binding protein [Chitinophagaceae bacterium]|nr:ABC transporter ATP-binding protein [Chitinophagaceae bacterium]